MSTANAQVLERYHAPIWGTLDRTLKNCLTGASIIGVLVLIMVFVIPKPAPEIMTVENVPDRLARLILEKPAAPVAKAPERVALQDQPKTEAKPEPPKPKAPPRTRTSKPKVAEDRGVAGRQKAQAEVTQNLAAVNNDLDRVLDNLSKTLPAAETSPDTDKPAPRRRRGSVRSGRSNEQLAAVQGSNPLAGADVSGSAIETGGIQIDAIADVSVTGAPDGGGATGGSATAAKGGNSDPRSNESLLSVVRRYAPGIQFCYDNELRKQPGLRGKLVVNLTVLASGEVSDAIVVENTLRSDRVTNCVLAQIRGWRFPAIAAGVVSFKTPFVFTPPE